MTYCWPLLCGGLYIALCGVESFQWWRKERSVEDIMRSCTFCHIEYSVEQLTIKTQPLLRMTNGTKNSPAWWVRRQGQYQQMKIMRDPSMLFIHSVASENISRIKNVFLQAWPEMGRWGEGPCPNNKITIYDSFSDVPESWVWLRADFQSGSRVLQIPSEMEVAPRYNCWNCWHCWHCSTLFDTVDMTYTE